MNPEETNDNEQTQAGPVAENPAPESATSAGAADTATNEQTEDVSEYRTFAILGYILPFLFFLPLLDDKTKNVPYVRFHANQQLILLVVILGLYVLHNVLFVMLMSLGYLVAQFINLAILALAIYGAYNAYLGNKKQLPFIGQFQILK